MHQRPCHVSLLQIEGTDTYTDQKNGIFYWGYYTCLNDFCQNYSIPTYFSNTVKWITT